jgi:predicted transcriptional regulator
MDIIKGNKRKTKQHQVAVDRKTHEKLSHLAYQNKKTRGEIIKQAIDLYQKVNIFDNLG